MTFSVAQLLGSLLAYLTRLFLVGWLADRGRLPARLTGHPAIYVLSLGVIAGGLAIYGASQLAMQYGYGFLLYYAGISLMLLLSPLLIAQGANDPRVKQAESDQIVGAMKEAGIPVTYVLYPDEGHGFAKPTNSIAFFGIAENFLSECLGGRAEPLGEVLTPSTAEIVEGAEHVKGLEDAIGG